MTALVAAPRPDDETMGCGGALRLAADQPERTVAFFLTSAEAHVPGAPVRGRESAEALRHRIQAPQRTGEAPTMQAPTMTDHRLRIAFVVDQFPVVSETFILDQITGLLDLGHQVDVYARWSPDPSAPLHPNVAAYDLLRRTTYVDEEIPPESGYWDLPAHPADGQTWLPGADAPVQNRARLAAAVPVVARCRTVAPDATTEVLDVDEYGEQAESLSALYRLDVLASLRRSYDVIHAHFGPVARSFRFVTRLWQAPLIVTFHGYDFSAWPRRHDPGVYARLFPSVAAVTVNSEYARGRLIDLGCPADLVHRLNVGVDVRQCSFRARQWARGEPLRLLTVARLTDKKGHETALRAVARLRDETGLRIRYDIVGAGPLADRLLAMVGTLGLEEDVRFHGAQPADVVRRFMAEAHLFLLASQTAADGDQEGTPVVLLEAQASGLPVVSTEHSGIPEIVKHGVTGYLVPEGGHDAMAAAIGGLVERPADWPRMGARGRAHVARHHDAGSLLYDLVQLYDRAIAVHQTGRGHV